ncbi:hypothetical protein [Pseudonocardia thermophila]|nr:hypothetical protein [Pseudonocardia thermophila]
MHHASQRHPFARRYGHAVAVSALLMILAGWAGSWLSAPFSLTFVLAAYLWSIGHSPSGSAAVGCDGCPAGCVGCRERIDPSLPEPR